MVMSKWKCQCRGKVRHFGLVSMNQHGLRPKDVSEVGCLYQLPVVCIGW